MIDIEKGIPIPTAGASRNFQSKYPFRTMDVGDSFFVEVGEDGDVVRLQRAIASAAARQKIRVSTRRVVEDETTGVRTWRIS